MVNAVVNKESVISKQLVNKVLKETVINLMDTKCDAVKDCRILWTTYNNIKLRFDKLYSQFRRAWFFIERQEKLLVHPSRAFLQHSKY